MSDKNYLLQELADLLDRDLNRLIHELELYESESAIWHTTAAVKNSGGNLALHLIGNLRHFIGHVLGDTGYQRDRNAEFSAMHISRNKILRSIEQCKSEIHQTFRKLREDNLTQAFPQPVGLPRDSTSMMLLHLLGHFNYHLGQINYHRRLLKGSK